MSLIKDARFVLPIDEVLIFCYIREETEGFLHIKASLVAD